MADRKVTGTGKTSDGTITSLCGAWGETTKAVAIIEIQINAHRYFTSDARGDEAEVKVIADRNGSKYLRTVPDLTKADNLASLPDC